ncbi:PREDICTED: uncharacterized protein LOC106819570 [Priapulus caudatus]|uniref:Uncharacterized protein LOC106819570 n=1 Tax=Priapulus caudatus TaxID=37621 RepID=A0ABM1F5E9_PRICU|nr:PREDICTED: uncharacterized protein LOC106819570 [Priapulus caudatus]
MVTRGTDYAYSALAALSAMSATASWAGPACTGTASISTGWKGIWSSCSKPAWSAFCDAATSTVVSPLPLPALSGCTAWESSELIKRGYVIVPSSAGAVIPLRGYNGETMYYAIKMSYFQGGRAGVGQAVASAAQAGRTAAAAVQAGSAGFRVSNAARAGFHGGASGTTGARFRTISVGQVPTTRLQQVRQIIGGPQRRVVPAVAQTGVFRTGFGDEFDTNTFGTLRAGNYGVPTFAGPYVDIGQFDFAARKEAAFASAPGDSRVKEGALQQAPVGRRYKSGFARQVESSAASGGARVGRSFVAYREESFGRRPMTRGIPRGFGDEFGIPTSNPYTLPIRRSAARCSLLALHSTTGLSQCLLQREGPPKKSY